VRAQGFAPKEIDVTIDASGGGRAVTLPRVELGGEGAVEGLVVDGRGDPVQGARVAKDRVPVFLAVGASPPAVAVTDARGRFRLAELAEGTCALEVYAPDLGRARLEAVRVSAGRTNDVGKVTLAKDGEAPADPSARGNVAVTLGEASDVREVVVVAVAEASVAERSGLAPGDVIVEIDSVPVHTIAEARAKLSGPLGDDVVLKLRRAGRPLTLRVAREEVRR
jgi:membrane-associated protease RseP (regulator of RpoE activity)